MLGIDDHLDREADIHCRRVCTRSFVWYQMLLVIVFVWFVVVVEPRRSLEPDSWDERNYSTVTHTVSIQLHN